MVEIDQVDRDLAETIATHLPYHSVPATWVTDLNLRVTFRRSQRTFTEYGDPFPHVVFTGGCTVTVEFPANMFTTPEPLQQRLRPGWDNQAVQRAVLKLLRDARWDCQLSLAQEELFKRYVEIATTGQVPLAILKDRGRSGDRVDRQQDIHKMSYSDLDFWHDFLTRLQGEFRHA
jgi:hypothetical protein